MTKSEFLEYALRRVIPSVEMDALLVQALGQLAELSAKVDGIADFIADRYVSDLANRDDAGAD